MRPDLIEPLSDQALDTKEWRARTSPSISWWSVVQGGLLAAALLYLYASVLPSLVADWWNDANYSHGFLIPLLSAYLVWERRQGLARLTIRPNAWGLVILLVGLATLFLGSLGAELFLMRASLIVVIAGLVWYLLGRDYLKLLAFPILFLVGMIPLPAIMLNSIAFPLQLLAARLSTASLQWVSLPVYREGNVIFLPHATLEVVEACSGIRSLVSLTVLAVVLAYFTQRSFGKRAVLVLSAVPVAIVANAFRIWGTGVLAYLYGPQAADDFYHTFAGWLVFAIAFVLLGMVGWLLSRLKRQPDRSEAGV